MESTTPVTKSSTLEPHAYISRAPGCGCVRMATVDAPERAREVAREISRAVRAGETVERVTCAYVRQIDWTNPDCEQHRRKSSGKPAATQPRLIETVS